MKTKNTYITVAALIAILQFSCVRDDADFRPDNDGTTEVSIDVLVPGNGYGEATRALTATRENHVEDITVLVFDAGGAFRYRADASSVQTTGSDNVKRFKVKLKTGQCDIWVFANCKDIIDVYTIPANATKTTLRQNLLLEISAKWNTTYAGYVPLPMWGERTGLNITPDMSLTGTGNRIPLIRAVAKVEVTIDRTTVPAADFTMEGMRFYHWSNRGQLVPDEAVLSSDKTKVTAISGNTGTTAAMERQTYGPSERDADGFFTNLIYVPETRAGTAGAITGNPCLIIYATYKGTAGWYKVELVDDQDNCLPLLRNYRYTFEIVKVGGRGYTTPDEAYKSKALNLTVRVHTHSDASLTNVMYDGQYWLAWDPDKFELDKEAHGATDDYHNLLQIETNCEDGWKFQRIEYPAGQPTDWLSITAAEQAGGKGVRGLVHFITTENTGAPRTAVVHFSAGRMDMSVEVTQSDENDMEILFFDADDNPIGDIYWVNTIEKKIQERMLRVKWTPAEANMSVTVHPATNDRRDVLYEPGGEITAGEVKGEEGFHDYLLRLSELRNEEALEDYNQYEYFRNKPYRTRYTFTLEYHGKQITKDLIIAHHLQLFELYTYQPDGYLMGVYYWDQSLGFAASAPFEYELSNNNPGLMTFFSGPHGSMVPGFNPWNNGNMDPGEYIDGYEWTINVKNPTFERRFQYETLTLRFPDSELPDTTIILKTQNILPNCYMVPPGQSVHIPVRNPWDARFIGHPYNRVMPLPELPVTGEFTCKLLWEDVDGLIENVTFTPAHPFDPHRTEMTVKTNGSRGEGNAVIALRRDGVIIWSWHVWVTAYDPDAPGAVHTYNSDSDPIYLMDRNLGATANRNDNESNKLRSVGLYYQGGRKDPFPPLGRIPTSQTETPALGEHKRVYPENNIFTTAEFTPPWDEQSFMHTITRTIENPTTFITSSSYPYDWYGDNTYWERWVRRQNEAELLDPTYIDFKVSYDPCPKGWMVANGDTKIPWRRIWDLSSSGKFFPSGNTATIPGNFGLSTTWGDFYPAAGYIDHINGVYKEVGFNVVVASGNFVTIDTISEEKELNGLEFAVGRLPYGEKSFPYATGRNVRCMKIDYYFPEND